MTNTNNHNQMRIEKDSLGPIEVPANKLWGAQTQRSCLHFNISSEKMPKEIIKALAIIKHCAATVNNSLGLLPLDKCEAISTACNEILESKHDEEFPLSVWQTGSGTQTNMNVNEVIANRGSQLLGGGLGGERLIHPNDDVNKSQSSNDVFPSSINIAVVLLAVNNLIPSIEELIELLNSKVVEFKDIIKVGRTHLQDAVPLTLGQEISAWIMQLTNALKAINYTLTQVRELAIGGTAVGTGLNAPKDFGPKMAYEISEFLNQEFVSAPNKFEALASSDAIVNFHGSLKTLASALMKVANDVRWLASGPRCGIGELTIPENEPGSSIMPGKVNPTQCEALTMICCRVFGNDVAINMGGAMGNFQLNVFRPVIAYSVIQSIKMLGDGIKSFTRYCVEGIKPNMDKINFHLEKSLMSVTALNPYIGYDKAAQIAKLAFKENLTLKEAAIKLGFLDETQFDKIMNLKEMVNI